MKISGGSAERDFSQIRFIVVFATCLD